MITCASEIYSTARDIGDTRVYSLEIDQQEPYSQEVLQNSTVEEVAIALRDLMAETIFAQICAPSNTRTPFLTDLDPTPLTTRDKINNIAAQQQVILFLIDHQDVIATFDSLHLYQSLLNSLKFHIEGILRREVPIEAIRRTVNPFYNGIYPILSFMNFCTAKGLSPVFPPPEDSFKYQYDILAVGEGSSVYLVQIEAGPIHLRQSSYFFEIPFPHLLIPIEVRAAAWAAMGIRDTDILPYEGDVQTTVKRRLAATLATNQQSYIVEDALRAINRIQDALKDIGNGYDLPDVLSDGCTSAVQIAYYTTSRLRAPHYIFGFRINLH